MLGFDFMFDGVVLGIRFFVFIFGKRNFRKRVIVVVRRIVYIF